MARNAEQRRGEVREGVAAADLSGLIESLEQGQRHVLTKLVAKEELERQLSVLNRRLDGGRRAHQGSDEEMAQLMLQLEKRIELLKVICLQLEQLTVRLDAACNEAFQYCQQRLEAECVLRKIVEEKVRAFQALPRKCAVRTCRLNVTREVVEQ